MHRDSRRRPFTQLVAAAALLGAVAALYSTPPAPAHPHEEDERGIISAPAADGSIEIQDVRFAADGSVSGVLVNRSASTLRDVRLLVRYVWHWRNEQSPGDYSPASSTFFTLDEEVPAFGTRPFRFSPTSPLPIRDDGHFEPTVEVAGYSQVGPAPDADHRR